MSQRYHIAVYAPAGAPAAAVQIHGIYGSMAEARSAVGQIVRDHVDSTHFVLDNCRMFLPVVNVDTGGQRFIGDTEEIGAPENDDHTKNRMGSVCELRRPASTSTPETTSPPFPTAKPADRRREVTTQREQLDELLRAPLPPSPSTADASVYARVREGYATLRAFERRLIQLLAEAQKKVVHNADIIEALDARHPEYRTVYHDHYLRALGESGIPSDSVPFMHYLTEGSKSC